MTSSNSNLSASRPVPFITLPNWVRAAARCGFDIAPLFRRHGIATDLIHLETTTVERGVLMRLMRDCVAQARGAHFPFALGESFAFDYVPELETFINTAPTLREAGRVFEWVHLLIDPGLTVRLMESGAVARLVLVEAAPDLPSHPYFVEAMVAGIVKVGRVLMRGEGDFTRLCFRQPVPEYVAEFQTFFSVPAVFGQAHDMLEFDRRLLDRPRMGAYPALHEQARVRIENRLRGTRRRDGLVATVENLLTREPALLAQGIEGTAGALHLHARTLQRRLLEQGERYADLLARVRYRLALQALEEPGVDLEALSERLGFSDRRSFTRAFTRWSGETPSAFRARTRSRPGGDGMS